MKTLVILPSDPSLRPLGVDSSVATATVSIAYDRPVAVDGRDIPRLAIIDEAVDADGVRVDVVCSDDPTITRGKGFGIVVEISATPVSGAHGSNVSVHRRISITSADPDVVRLGDKPDAHTIPASVVKDVESLLAGAKLTVGTVTTGAPGSQAAATLTGTAPNQVLGLTIPQGPKGDKGDIGQKGDPGPVTLVDADKLAIARGYHEILSFTEPASKTYRASDGNVYPVVWIKPSVQIVPVVPMEPVYDSTRFTVNVPSLVGVDYRVTSLTKDSTTTAKNVLVTPNVPFDLKEALSVTEPFTVTVSAVAKPGYSLPGTFSWSARFIDPTQLSLLASTGFNTEGDTAAGVPLDYYAGGSRTGLVLRLLKSGISARDTHFVQKDGYLYSPVESEWSTYGISKADNTWVGFPLDLTDNLQVKFELIDLGTPSSDGYYFNISVLAGSNDPASNARVTFSTSGRTSGKTAVTTATGFNVLAQTGTWSVQFIAGVLTVTVPSGEQFTLSNNLAPVGHHLWFRVISGSTGTKIDNLRVFGTTS